MPCNHHTSIYYSASFRLQQNPIFVLRKNQPKRTRVRTHANRISAAAGDAKAVLAVLVVAAIGVYCGCCRRQTGDGARPPAPHVVQNGMFSFAAPAPAPAAQQDEAGYQLPNARQSEMYDNAKLDQSWLAGAGVSAEYAVVVDSGVDTAGYQVPSAEQE